MKKPIALLAATMIMATSFSSFATTRQGIFGEEAVFENNDEDGAAKAFLDNKNYICLKSVSPVNCLISGSTGTENLNSIRFHAKCDISYDFLSYENEIVTQKISQEYFEQSSFFATVSRFFVGVFTLGASSHVDAKITAARISNGTYNILVQNKLPAVEKYMTSVDVQKCENFTDQREKKITTSNVKGQWLKDEIIIAGVMISPLTGLATVAGTGIYNLKVNTIAGTRELIEQAKNMKGERFDQLLKEFNEDTNPELLHLTPYKLASVIIYLQDGLVQAGCGYVSTKGVIEKAIIRNDYKDADHYVLRCQ